MQNAVNNILKAKQVFYMWKLTFIGIMRSTVQNVSEFVIYKWSSYIFSFIFFPAELMKD